MEKRCPGETIEVAECSLTTQRIRQKSNPSSFSDRKRPLDSSRKNNQGPLPANLGFLEQTHPICTFLQSKALRGPYGPLGVKAISPNQLCVLTYSHSIHQLILFI